jgi:DNA-binding transcriptional ArsR family regulator
VVTYGDGPWEALGDPTRRAILEQLARRPSAVVDLARELPVSRPAVSQHLRVLKQAGLVVDRAEGTRRVYALHTAGLAVLRRDLDRLWTHALAGAHAG